MEKFSIPTLFKEKLSKIRQIFSKFNFFSSVKKIFEQCPEKVPTHWFIFQMPMMARGQTWKPRIQLSSPMWMAGNKYVSHHFLSSRKLLLGTKCRYETLYSDMGHSQLNSVPATVSNIQIYDFCSFLNITFCGIK